MKYQVINNADGVSIKAVNPHSQYALNGKWIKIVKEDYENFNKEHPALPVHPDSVPLVKGLTEWEGEVEEQNQWLNEPLNTWYDCEPDDVETMEWAGCKTRKVAKLIAPEVKAVDIGEVWLRGLYSDEAYDKMLSDNPHLKELPELSLTKENDQGEIKSAEEILTEHAANIGYSSIEMMTAMEEDSVCKEIILSAMNRYAVHIAKLAVTEALKRASEKAAIIGEWITNDMGNDICITGTLDKQSILSIADEIDEIIKELSE